MEPMTALWIGLIAAFAAVAAWATWLFSDRNRDVVSEVTALNPEGEAGTALVVYHPGKSDFQRRVFSGFAEGLVASGWQVEMTTPSSQAPTDLTGYDLLVLGGPTYGFTPNRPIQRYLSRLGDLGGKRTVTIITALGMGDRSTEMMQRLVRQANGELLRALVLYKSRPNDDDNFVDGEQNQDLAVEIATQAAREIELPAVQERAAD
jgi:flavorubredoxin